MSLDRFYLNLRCLRCSWDLACNSAEIRVRLAGLGMLRRQAVLDVEELRELATAAADRLTCDSCGAVGLRIQAANEESDWPEAARCEVCAKAIPPERLEVFPDTRICVACQTASEQGTLTDAVSYCPRCGSPMIVRQSRGAGLARYEMVCSDFPRCRGRG